MTTTATSTRYTPSPQPGSSSLNTGTGVNDAGPRGQPGIDESNLHPNPGKVLVYVPGHYVEATMADATNMVTDTAAGYNTSGVGNTGGSASGKIVSGILQRAAGTVLGKQDMKAKGLAKEHEGVSQRAQMRLAGQHGHDAHPDQGQGGGIGDHIGHSQLQTDANNAPRAGHASDPLAHTRGDDLRNNQGY